MDDYHTWYPQFVLYSTHIRIVLWLEHTAASFRYLLHHCPHNHYCCDQLKFFFKQFTQQQNKKLKCCLSFVRRCNRMSENTSVTQPTTTQQRQLLYCNKPTTTIVHEILPTTHIWNNPTTICEAAGYNIFSQGNIWTQSLNRNNRSNKSKSAKGRT
jgi:hypothetical protein